MNKKITFLILTGFLLIIWTVSAQQKAPVNKVDLTYADEVENLDVFQQWIKWNNPGSLLIHYMIRQAMEYYELRHKEISKLQTKADWLNRQAYVKGKLMESIGGLPERTPLNPKITGVIKKEGFRVEKLVYESMPGFYVTGCVFIPEKIKGKAPAVLNVIGHNQEAFRADLYQLLILNLVKKGIIVLAIDPPGQGEHVQYFDPEINFSSVGYTVIEHSYFSNQCFLTGYSSAKYFIWDGIRGIDYLISRRDVDPSRIGVTGFSGGGTITSYVSAFDERVKVSVPCSWATWYERLLETKGVQDGESLFYHGLVNGLSFDDLIEVRAPKPTLMTAVSRDQYLNLQGARETLAEAGKAYAAFGMKDNLQLVEDDFMHWMTPEIRYRIYAFFMKHFNLAGDPSEEVVDFLKPEELKVTPTGQISTSYGGDMIFDVNKRLAEKLFMNLENSRKNADKHLAQVKSKAKELSGYIIPLNSDEGAFINGRYQREGYTVGKYAIMGEGDYAVPILLFVPDDKAAKHPAIVYIHSAGKAAEAKPGAEIEKLVRKGYIVAATDVLGVGETKNTAARASKDAYTAVLIGRSVVGVQAADIVRVVNYLKNLEEVDPSRIGAMALNEMCIPLIHAAAFEPSIKNVILIGSPVSYRDIVINRLYKIGLIRNEKGGTNHPYEVDFSWGVAGALTAYDLPDLIAGMVPRKVVLARLKNHALETASDSLVNQEMSFPRSVYTSKGVAGNLNITSFSGNTGDLLDWSFK